MIGLFHQILRADLMVTYHGGAEVATGALWWLSSAKLVTAIQQTCLTVAVMQSSATSRLVPTAYYSYSLLRNTVTMHNR